MIESVDAFEFFIDVFYEALGIRKGWSACLQNIYCKCSIYAFVSNPTILSAQIGGKAQRGGGGGGGGGGGVFKSVRTPCQLMTP